MNDLVLRLGTDLDILVSLTNYNTEVFQNVSLHLMGLAWDRGRFHRRVWGAKLGDFGNGRRGEEKIERVKGEMRKLEKRERGRRKEK